MSATLPARPGLLTRATDRVDRVAGRPLDRLARRVVGHSLAERELEETELMDDPACDAEALRRTYRQFVTVNRLVSGWRAVYVRRLRPLLSAETTTTLLDVGSGGGDVPRALARWAARDGLLLAITAIDPDDRATTYARSLPPVPGVTFRPCFSSELVREGARFDVVTSNHVLHHLDAAALAGLLDDSAALARRLVVHDDIARSPLAALGYWVGTLPLHRRGRPHASFVRDDGLLSVRRSYRPEELATVLPDGWTVERLPFRALAVLDRTAATGDTGTALSDAGGTRTAPPGGTGTATSGSTGTSTGTAAGTAQDQRRA